MIGNWLRIARDARLARVLAIYASSGFVALQVIGLLRDQLELPSWVFTSTLALLIAGLPIVIVTALVQQRVRSPDALEDATAKPATPAMTELRRWFTWRKFALGAGLAGVTLVIFVVANRALAGASATNTGNDAASRNQIVVGVFRSVGDSTLGATVAEAIRIDLAHSTTVVPLTVEQIRETLERMQRPPNTVLDRDVAREVAIRQGAKAYLTGEITRLGDGYVITVELMSADSGKVLLAERFTAANGARLINTVDRLSGEIRRRAGEPLRQVKASPPLAAVATPSLEALRKYTLAQKAHFAMGDDERAIELLEEAIRIDTLFVLAHRTLGVVLGNRGEASERRDRALAKAFQYRDRLPLSSRYTTEGLYYSNVEADYPRAVQAYRTQSEINGHSPGSNALIGNIYRRMGNFAAAESVYTAALAAQDSGAAYPFYTNLATTQFDLGKDDAANQTMELFGRHHRGHPRYYLYNARFAASRRDYGAADRYLTELERTQPTSRQWRTEALLLRRHLAAVHGKLQEAERLSEQRVAMFDPARRAALVISQAAGMADVDALLGFPAKAAKRLESTLAEHRFDALEPNDRPYLQLATAWALAGRVREAQRLVAEYQRVTGPGELRQEERVLQQTRAVTALMTKDVSGALIAARAAAAPPCMTCGLPWLARAFEQAGMPDSAIVAHTRFLETRDWSRGDADVRWLAMTYERLGQLYETRGDAQRARHYYGLFVELWKNADPELQPRVTRAKARLNALLETRN